MNVRESLEALEEQTLSPYASFLHGRGEGIMQNRSVIYGRSIRETGIGSSTVRHSAG